MDISSIHFATIKTSILRCLESLLRLLIERDKRIGIAKSKIYCLSDRYIWDALNVYSFVYCSLLNPEESRASKSCRALKV